MSSAFTREMLAKALAEKSALNTGSFPTGLSLAQELAEAITAHGLLDVIAGRHDGKPVTFAKGFELVFGERLTLKRSA